MINIITLNNNEPVIDTLDMAIGFDMQHRSIMRLVSIHEESIKKFGKVRFEITPSKSGQNQRHTYLNEAQATFVGTLMNNKGRAIEFKIKLVKQFQKMKNYIQKQETIRLSGIETRKSLTDKIEESGEFKRMHGHAYSTYTNLIYSLTDLTFRYREYSRHSRTGFRDSLTGDDLKRVELAESLIKPLLEMNKQYSEIKDTLKPLFQEKIK